MSDAKRDNLVCPRCGEGGGASVCLSRIALDEWRAQAWCLICGAVSPTVTGHDDLDAYNRAVTAWTKEMRE